jgi:arylsulfatase A-like enzyme
LKVGLPGAKEGLQARDVTVAELLKAQGYMTGQFGKNHLGDLDEHLPTVHGFHEFMGSLYHLNAEDEPEHEDYFKNPEMRRKYGTRGVIHTWANPDGTQKIESTGALNKKRMKPSTTRSPTTIRFMTMRRRPASLSSSGGTQRACTSGRGSRNPRAARPGSVSIRTAWSSTMPTSAACSTR